MKTKLLIILTVALFLNIKEAYTLEAKAKVKDSIRESLWYEGLENNIVENREESNEVRASLPIEILIPLQNF